MAEIRLQDLVQQGLPTGFTGSQGEFGYTGSQGDTGFVGSKGDIGDLNDISGVSESYVDISGATGVVNHDCSLSSVFRHTSMSANFTVNFTNVPTTDLRNRVVVLILVQGSTARVPTAAQIDGAAQTIKWNNGITASGTANGVDLITFSLLRSGSSWTVLGQSSSYT
jgi:hypothetical protein